MKSEINSLFSGFLMCELLTGINGLSLIYIVDRLIRPNIYSIKCLFYQIPIR